MQLILSSYVQGLSCKNAVLYRMIVWMMSNQIMIINFIIINAVLNILPVWGFIYRDPFSLSESWHNLSMLSLPFLLCLLIQNYKILLNCLEVWERLSRFEPRFVTINCRVLFSQGILLSLNYLIEQMIIDYWELKTFILKLPYLIRKLHWNYHSF